ncbi:MAG TPA: hypothetical protein P5136_01105 [Methanofastidiosum sp.]|nr:hypothetical protein [Methanofastidiosum sp.]
MSNEAQIYIEKIEKATKLTDVVTEKPIFANIKNIIKLIHPDICSLPGAQEAFIKLQELKNVYVNGITYTDDAGEVNTNNLYVKLKGDPELLKISYRNFLRLKSSTTNAALFHRYIPNKMTIQKDSEGNPEVLIDLQRRGVPISQIPLPLDQNHVNWILSRVLEFTTWLKSLGMVHCGLNPESIFVTPEDHGIQIISFYHMTPINSKVNTISGGFKQWYPPELFTEKKATHTIDIELAKRMAAYLLGDKSGLGIKLRKTHNKDFLDFLVKRQDDPVEAFSQYRELVQRNFEKRFYELNL